MNTFFSKADLFSSGYPNILSISVFVEASIAALYSASNEKKM